MFDDNSSADGQTSGNIDELLSSFANISGSDEFDAKRALSESPLGSALNNMMVQWNSLLSQIVTEVDHPQPILEHIKETAEFSVKQFRDACLAMNSELTRVSMDWQLKYPSEISKQEIAEYENSIKRQQNLLSKMKQKLGEISP